MQAIRRKRYCHKLLGEVMLNIQIGDLVLPTRFVVSDNITEPMLGVEWLHCNQMTWKKENAPINT